MLFTFPSRYWFTIGRGRVFSLGGWSPQIPTGFHVSRGTWVPGGSRFAFAYGAITLYGCPFQNIRLTIRFLTPMRPAPQPRTGNPVRFRLFPFRSPLLGESQLLSLPPGTEMVHFPGLPSRDLLDSVPDNRGLPGWIAPFGDPRIIGCLHLLAAYRSLPRPSSAVRAKAFTVWPG